MLRDLRVIELATYIAAPGAAGIMADWGADVIKIESPDGDPMRGFFESLGSDQDANPIFELDNRGKRSVVLDIRSPGGSAAAKALVKDADIFLTNVRPAALARAGLDYETLKAVNPRLIYCSLTGYGLEGPDADKPGMDVAAFWSRAGVGAITAPKGQEPFPIRTGMGDHVTSLATVSAILAAVHERQRTGVGRLVETSLLRTGVYAIGSDMAIQLRFGKLASTRPRKEAVQPLGQFLQDPRRAVDMPAGPARLHRLAPDRRRRRPPRPARRSALHDGPPAPRQYLGPGGDPRPGLRRHGLRRGQGRPRRRRHHLGALADAARSGQRPAGGRGGVFRGDPGWEGRDLPRPGGSGAVSGVGRWAEGAGA